MARRISRWLFLLVAVLPLTAWVTAARASDGGVLVTVYDNYGYNNAPPVPPDRPVAGVLVQQTVQNNFDAMPLFGMYEDFMVKYEGYLTTATSGPVWFYAPADDGVQMTVSGQQIINDWYDKGGGGSVSAPVEFAAGVSQPFVLWFYENGGGAWVELYWNRGEGWEPVPADAFTLQQAVPPTTTTTTSTSTSTSTTTSTTTTVLPPVTTAEPTTTTEPPASTTTAPETTTTSSTTTVPVPAQTTTTASPTTTVLQTTTTSSTTSTTVAAMIAPTTTTLPAEPESASLSEISAALTDAKDGEITAEQAEELVSTIVDSIQNLTDSELESLAVALTAAPSAVKKAFEAKVNVFGGKFDTYVPTGSTITVGQRRAVNAIVVTTVAVPAAAAATRRRT